MNKKITLNSRFISGHFREEESFSQSISLWWLELLSCVIGAGDHFVHVHSKDSTWKCRVILNCPFLNEWVILYALLYETSSCSEYHWYKTCTADDSKMNYKRVSIIILPELTDELDRSKNRNPGKDNTLIHNNLDVLNQFQANFV